VADYWNDAMSSWICGKNVEYWFCDNLPNDDCRNGHGESGAGAAYNPIVGHNDGMTSLKMYSYDQINGPGAAIIYSDANCRNESWTIFSLDVN